LAGCRLTVSLPLQRAPRSTLFPYTTLFRSLLDDRRAAIDSALVRQTQRGDSERLLLKIAIGAATERAYLSYPRLDVAETRARDRSEEHTSELQSPYDLVCRLLPEKKKTKVP